MYTGTNGTGGRPRIRVFAVDDHAVVREGLRRLSEREPDLDFCGEAGNSADALRHIADAHPDVVVVDLSLGHASGLEFLKDVKARWPEVALLVLTSLDETVFAERSLRAGATGYVMKSEPLLRIVEGIRTVRQGQLFLSDGQTRRMLQRLTSGPAEAEPGAAASEVLTDREVEVLEFVGRGLRTREIARNLHLSVKTVEWHRAQIKRKLHLRDANELLRYAFHWVSRLDSCAPQV